MKSMASEACSIGCPVSLDQPWTKATDAGAISGCQTTRAVRSCTRGAPPSFCAVPTGVQVAFMPEALFRDSGAGLRLRAGLSYEPELAMRTGYSNWLRAVAIGAATGATLMPSEDASSATLPELGAKPGDRQLVTSAAGYYRYYDDDGDEIDNAPPPRYYEPPVYGWTSPPLPPPPPRPASCGEYRYWNGEFCADARYYRPYVGPRW
jgi:hypothetical protein